MQILLMIHSLVRWLIVLVAVAAIVKFTFGWLRGGKFEGMDRGLSSAFSGLVDLQVTLGIIYFLWDGFVQTGFPMYRIEHAIIMIIAAAVAHMSAMWKKAEDRLRFRNTLFAILASLVIIFIGVAILPGGWTN